jgi:hypothetical protein
MKSLVLAGATAVAIALLGTVGASAAPVNGTVIGQAVAADQLAQDVGYRRHWRWGSRGWHSRWRSWHRY